METGGGIELLLSRTVFSGGEKSCEVVRLGEGKFVEERLYDEEPRTEVRGEARSEKEEAGEDELGDEDGLDKDGLGNRVFWRSGCLLMSSWKTTSCVILVR